jgi:hypothetical protein
VSHDVDRDTAVQQAAQAFADQLEACIRETRTPGISSVPAGRLRTLVVGLGAPAGDQRDIGPNRVPLPIGATDTSKPWPTVLLPLGDRAGERQPPVGRGPAP